MPPTRMASKAAARQKRAREKRAMQIGAALKQLLELDAELGPVLGTMASGKAPPSREQVARLAAKQKRVRGLLLQLKPKKLGPLPKAFPKLEAIGRSEVVARKEEADRW